RIVIIKINEFVHKIQKRINVYSSISFRRRDHIIVINQVTLQSIVMQNSSTFLTESYNMFGLNSKVIYLHRSDDTQKWKMRKKIKLSDSIVPNRYDLATLKHTACSISDGGLWWQIEYPWYIIELTESYDFSNSHFYKICQNHECTIEKTPSVIIGKNVMSLCILNFEFLRNYVTITIYLQTIIKTYYKLSHSPPSEKNILG
ncbi:hypothetical protein AGLY_007611, partial [Aphis glycines]